MFVFKITKFWESFSWCKNVCLSFLCYINRCQLELTLEHACNVSNLGLILCLGAGTETMHEECSMLKSNREGKLSNRFNAGLENLFFWAKASKIVKKKSRNFKGIFTRLRSCKNTTFANSKLFPTKFFANLELLKNSKF